MILSGHLAPRQELRQDSLAGKLGISRTPLREALNRLASEGLVEFRPRRSAVVAELTRADVEADYEARRILEPAAARLAAARRDPEALAALNAAVRTAERVGDDVERRFEASRAFHHALVAAAGNRHLSRFGAELWGGRAAPYVYARQARLPDRARIDRAEHAEIARLVAAGDAEGAARAVDAHLQAALAALLGAPSSTQPPSGGGTSSRRGA